MPRSGFQARLKRGVSPLSYFQRLGEIKMANQDFPRYPKTKQTGDKGVRLVEKIFSDDFGWIFRSQDDQKDVGIIGKYLSRLRKFDQVIALQERFEAQLQAPRLAITFGMRALGMTGQIRDGRFQRVIEPCDVPGLQGLDNPA